MSAIYPLLIVGGGMHGTIISLALSQYLPSQYHAVIDRHDAPLQQWLRNCRACGLTYLRSPAAHHLSSDPQSLRRFFRSAVSNGDLASVAAVATQVRPAAPPFIPRYDRPRFDLFMAHAHHLIELYNLRRVRVRALCRHIAIGSDRVTVWTDRGEFAAERLLLCTGMTAHPAYPDWALPFIAATSPSAALASSTAPAHRRPPPITHVFAAGFCLSAYRSCRRVVIVGGGITALQLAINLSTAGTDITVLSRHQIRCTDFDSDPCYLGPGCLRAFDRIADPAERYERIVAARNRGAVPPDIVQAFRACCQPAPGTATRCRLIIGETARLTIAPEQHYRFTLTSGDCITADAAILATGWQQAALTNPLIADLHRRYRLPLTAAGLPITDRHLRWHPRVLLSGSYAALIVGPAAGNIIGAHLALRRIMPLLLGRRYRATWAWRPLHTVIGAPPPHRAQSCAKTAARR